MNQFITLPKILNGLLSAFMTIMMVRVTYPISTMILSWFDSGQMRVAAILVYWLIIFATTWVFTWMVLFSKNDEVNQNA